MADMSRDAAAAQARLILFSEAAITGFINTGEPAFDRTLGQPIPGPATVALAQIAIQYHMWIGFGLFETTHNLLYDAAVLLAPDGTIALHYRRIDPHWHHWWSRPASFVLYAQGTTLPYVETPLGRCAFLICGDLFNASCHQQLATLPVDWLLFPMARGFDTEVSNAKQWQEQERDVYVQQAQTAGVNMLLVNQLSALKSDRQFFGGALAVQQDGVILGEWRLHQAGTLIVDVPTGRGYP
jgi:N-carbamoylputrescine amidase